MKSGLHSFLFLHTGKDLVLTMRLNQLESGTGSATTFCLSHSLTFERGSKAKTGFQLMFKSGLTVPHSGSAPSARKHYFEKCVESQ